MWPVTSSEPWQPTGKRHGWTAYLCPLLLGAQGSLSRAPGFKTSGASQEAAPPPRHEARRCLEVTPVGRWPEPSAPAHTHALPRAKAAPSLPSLLFGHENNPALSGVATGSHCPGQALGSLGHHQPGLWVLPRVPRVPGTGTRLFTGLVSPPTLTAHHRHTHTHLHPPTHTHARIRDDAVALGASAPGLGRKACGTRGGVLRAPASHPQEPEPQGSREGLALSPSETALF